MKQTLTQTFLEEQISNIDKTIDALEEQRKQYVDMLQEVLYKPKKFSMKLHYYMEDRIFEIFRKINEKRFNSASLDAFWVGLESDIEGFLKKNQLQVVKKTNKLPKNL
jgi:hypothetical protein